MGLTSWFQVFWEAVFSRIADSVAMRLVFGGDITKSHTTAIAVGKLCDRYEHSVAALNRSLAISVGFAFLALYAYFGLATGSGVPVPFLRVDIPADQWIRLCPAISYAVQLHVFAAGVWFLALRRSLLILGDREDAGEHFADTTTIALSGFLGIVRVLITLRSLMESRWHLIWLAPVGAFVALVVLSPTILCGYFIVELFTRGDMAFAITYATLFVPSVLLSVLLLVMGQLLSVPFRASVESSKHDDPQR